MTQKHKKFTYKNKKTSQNSKLFLYGKHPVLEALRNPKRTHVKLYCTKNALNFLTENLPETILKKIQKEIVSPNEVEKIINSRSSDITHQGIALETTPLPQPNIEEVSDSDILVACNKITDPHNIGTILRNAAAFGASAVITDERNSPPENATIAKTSVGCIEKIPYIRDKSLGNSIKYLKSQGYLVIGLDGNGTENLSELTKKLNDEKILLIIGSEGKGMSSNIIEMCDYVTKIEISEHAESLNASVASAIALFQLYTK